MPEISDKQTAIATLEEWRRRLLTEPHADQLSQLPVDYAFDSLEVSPSCITFLYGSGDALIMGVARHTVGEHFLPYLVVTEKTRRSHTPGLGHRQDSRPRKCGFPNCARAIEKVLTRR